MIHAFGKDSPDAVFAFLEHNISARGREHWCWKYRTAAGETSSAFYWQEDDGSVLGFIGLMRTTLHTNTRQTLAAWFVDWHVQPGAKGVGVGIALLRKAEAAAGVLLTLQGSADTRKILPRMGWQQSFSPVTWLRPLSGRFLSAWLQQHIHVRVPAISGVFSALAWPFLRVSPESSPAGLELVEVDRIPEDYDDVWKERAQELVPVMRRDSDYLNYFCADYPGGGYRIRIVELHKKKVGHLITRVDRDDRGLTRGRIVDLVWPESRPELAAWLVNEGTADLQNAGADYVECLASTPRFQTALEGSRFRARRAVPIWYHRLAADVPDPDAWHITLLDCDRAYR